MGGKFDLKKYLNNDLLVHLVWLSLENDIIVMCFQG